MFSWKMNLKQDAAVSANHDLFLIFKVKTSWIDLNSWENCPREFLSYWRCSQFRQNEEIKKMFSLFLNIKTEMFLSKIKLNVRVNHFLVSVLSSHKSTRCMYSANWGVYREPGYFFDVGSPCSPRKKLRFLEALPERSWVYEWKIRKENMDLRRRSPSSQTAGRRTHLEVNCQVYPWNQRSDM